MQDKLTVAELRRLIEKLKKRRIGKDKTISVVDYERFCSHLLGAPDSIPNSRSEAVLQIFQDAAMTSASEGKSFLQLCGMIDQRQNGVISKEELVHTAKMMDCPLTFSDIDALRDLGPSAFRMGNGGVLLVGYRELNDILTTHSPRGDSMLDRNPFNGEK